MRVRPAEINDIPRLLAIERQSPSAAHWSEREYHALFPGPRADEGSVPRRICLVAEMAAEIAANSNPNSAIAGFVVALCMGQEWEIENIVVDSALRRRGCANLLLRELLSLASNEGAGRVLLEVRESNQAARAFYARWGFQMIGRRRNYYRDPEEDAILLHFRCNSRSP
ncbi:MAG: ribosomal protein S18-alanine N-acetyltransferase [Candidatus Korobacteraceae bacterium]|jgi:ribosomal-protein-alanine N-acetyltransferase